MTFFPAQMPSRAAAIAQIASEIKIAELADISQSAEEQNLFLWNTRVVIDALLLNRILVHSIPRPLPAPTLLSYIAPHPS
ncbi:MAG: hypothetical protein DMF68_04875 [Acidobacteria bacterium]|nr:MAG: hypothetical protein DMF68_04875 [Acidobacteriota bacterium]